MYVDRISTFMKYEYDERTGALKVISFERNPERPDTISVEIDKFDGNSMEWRMVFYKDTLRMNLRKEGND